MDRLLSLPKLTTNNSKAGLLERMLDRNAASYKHCLLRAIVDEVAQGNTSASFTRLVARMVAHVWYPVVCYRLYLGASDRLLDVIAHLRDSCGVPDDSPRDAIISLIESEVFHDATLAKLISDRARNVPFRLIRPFYEEGIARAKARDPRWYDPKTDDVIFKLNRLHPQDCIYEIWPDRAGVSLNPAWTRFISDNLPVIDGWLDFRLTQYLQARNPSVPAVSLKLHRPTKRNLSAATRYWKRAVDVLGLREIYSGQPFGDEAYKQRGTLSIDHFVPWSFVLHDEPWNLEPMFKNTNSSKSDRLPNLGRFLRPFCMQQFDALLALRDERDSRTIVESYLSIDPHLGEYVDTDASRASFSTSLANTITPLYQIALNQGYAVWEFA